MGRRVQGLVMLVIGVRPGMRNSWLMVPCGSRSPPVQQRTLLRHALWDGDQILQRPRSALPHEEGAASALEDCAGKEGPWDVGGVVWYLAEEGILPSELAVIAPSSCCGVQFCFKPDPRFSPLRKHWILVSGAGYEG